MPRSLHLTPAEYLDQIRADSARFAAVIRATGSDDAVPTCPDWTADDLLHHLAEVQWFWARIVRDGLTDDEAVESLEEPERPADRGALLDQLEHASGSLVEALDGADPGEERWTWADDHTVGFVLRRQTHEALVHRIDAELTANAERAEVAPAVAADGIDEALRVMFGGAPDWATVETDESQTLRILATDTGDTWLVTAARFTGTAPSGNVYDEGTLVIAEDDHGTPAAATVSGHALDLDCWLWSRPALGSLEREGDAEVHRAVQQVLDHGIE